MASTTTVNWGIISCGKISWDFCRAFAFLPSDLPFNSVVKSCAARSAADAETFSKDISAHLGYAPTPCDSYSSLLSDSSLDVIYIGSVHGYHFDLCKLALNMGAKAVLCEKPLTCSAAETAELVSLASSKGAFFMEGLWTRCFPAARKVRDVLSSGVLGPVSYVSCDFGWGSSGCDSDHRIFEPNTGGYTFDIGQYCAHWALMAYGGRPVNKVFASGSVVAGVDHTVAASVFFGAADAAQAADKEDGGGGGGVLQFLLTGDATTEERLVIQGSRGRVVVNAPHHVPTSVSVIMNTGKADKTQEFVQEFAFPLPVEQEPAGKWNFGGSVGFIYEIEEVGRCVTLGKKQSDCFTTKESIAMAKILGEIRAQVLGNN